ncbi:hypothetical protein E8E13_010668 [Curvularia kusanoi]|uniref:Uncharacterized protein n=1 Tax=Curvularia kusanoi TaxID=90978 RepID=A0A9P4TGY8_CURKU|nr:hypothetical protein E8E13_010668 [Curvularia kusanoi]
MANEELAAKMTAAEQDLCNIARALKKGAQAVGLELSEKYDLREEASKVVTDTILHVSEIYRKPIYQVCDGLHLRHIVWPKPSHTYKDELAAVMDQFAQDFLHHSKYQRD